MVTHYPWTVSQHKYSDIHANVSPLQLRYRGGGRASLYPAAGSVCSIVHGFSIGDAYQRDDERFKTPHNPPDGLPSTRVSQVQMQLNGIIRPTILIARFHTQESPVCKSSLYGQLKDGISRTTTPNSFLGGSSPHNIPHCPCK